MIWDPLCWPLSLLSVGFDSTYYAAAKEEILKHWHTTQHTRPSLLVTYWALCHNEIGNSSLTGSFSISARKSKASCDANCGTK